MSAGAAKAPSQLVPNQAMENWLTLLQRYGINSYYVFVPTRAPAHYTYLTGGPPKEGLNQVKLTDPQSKTAPAILFTSFKSTQNTSIALWKKTRTLAYCLRGSGKATRIAGVNVYWNGTTASRCIKDPQYGYVKVIAKAVPAKGSTAKASLSASDLELVVTYVKLADSYPGMPLIN